MCSPVSPVHQINAVFGQNVWTRWWHYVKGQRVCKSVAFLVWGIMNIHTSLGISFLRHHLNVSKLFTGGIFQTKEQLITKLDGSHRLETWLGVVERCPLSYFLITVTIIWHERQLRVLTLYSAFCWLIFFSLARNLSGKLFCYMIFFPEEHNVHLCKPTRTVWVVQPTEQQVDQPRLVQPTLDFCMRHFLCPTNAFLSCEMTLAHNAAIYFSIFNELTNILNCLTVSTGRFSQRFSYITQQKPNKQKKTTQAHMELQWNMKTKGHDAMML